MNVSQFIAKWRRVALTERSASQQHFLDLCEVLDHPKPAEADPLGGWFTFERGAAKTGGGEGWADVWKRGFFGWEYKGRHKDLDAAYQQLLKYREALENPPLLVVCDMDRIVVHTNFTNTPNVIHEIRLEELDNPRSLEILRAVFNEPEKLKPGATSAAITEEAASHLAEIAQSLRDAGHDPLDVARFLDRIIFSLFAEDIGLLPPKIFSRIVEKSRHDPDRFQRQIELLFGAMAKGGDFGADEIRYFNGNLFSDGKPLKLTEDAIDRIYQAARLEWSSVEPSIFGTLFERGLDPAKRSQIGAHYTSRQDIETLVEPVVMQPLRREWDEVRRVVENVLTTGAKQPKGGEKKPTGKAFEKARLEADILLDRFLRRLAAVKVLDPACGSGNFLYVTLQKLKDLEKEVVVWAMEHDLPSYFPGVGPWQLYGIEINPYAFELAQMTVWIGYLQWVKFNGFEVGPDPILRPMDTFRCMDAILDLSDPEHPKEPEWPAVEFIVGNPPFLGGKRIRAELGDSYFESLLGLYEDRLPPFSDLCCYWFEKARMQIAGGQSQRAGLLATQGIRGGANREVLKRIKESGDIYFAESDREWVLDGANVHVSMIGFDDGTAKTRVLDRVAVLAINPNLTTCADITRAGPLAENAGRSFIGIQKSGPFDMPQAEAMEIAKVPNPDGRFNSDVVRPYLNALDIVRRPQDTWIIDFGQQSLAEAALYEAPLERVRRMVKPMRDVIRRDRHRVEWWLYGESRQGMHAAVNHMTRSLATPHVSKHRLFVWIDSASVPSNLLIVVACEDDYSFGVLQSRFHETWARAQGTQVRERESGFRYTPTTCFETFPFPWAPGTEPRDDPKVTAIAAAARELDELRTRWLNPPEWVREEVLEFPGSTTGPWARYVHDPDARGIGTVRYPRLVARDADRAAKLAKRTLTNLYNERPTWLALAHEKLDAAVFAAYGWDSSMGDEGILEKLLEMNLERAGTERRG
jgi:type II restriction/modification system DNA methylase subunit YeeA